MSMFLLVQNFWEGLFPEEELPDLIINVLAEAIGFEVPLQRFGSFWRQASTLGPDGIDQN